MKGTVDGVEAAIVGRDDELRRIRAALDRGGSTASPAVVITGEAGIGKSRLLNHVGDGLRRRGWQVLAGAADPLERQIPYAALVRALAGFAADADPDIAATATDVVGSLDRMGVEARTDVEASFGRTCGQVVQLIRALIERGPVSVFIDDLQNLDDDTLALLAIVLRRVPAGRAAFFATSRVGRAQAPLAVEALLSRLEAAGELTEVQLGPLAPDAIATLITPLVGDAAVPGEILTRSEGNPFFALELAAAHKERGGGLPLTRRSAVLQRFLPLDPTRRAVVRALSVLGRAGPEHARLLASLTSMTEAEAVAAFDELIADGLLHASGDAFSFAHDLVREAVYTDIGPAEQRRLHRAAADHLLEARGRGRPVETLSLARHLGECAEIGEAEAIVVLVEAGDATRAVAPGSAAALYGRALDLTPLTNPARPGVLARQCRAYVLAGRPVAAVDAGRAALAGLAAGSAERRRTATAVIGSLFELGRVEDALAVADAEVAAGNAGAVVEAQRPMLLWFSGRFDDAHTEWHRLRGLGAGGGERILVLGQLAMGAATFYEQQALLDIVDELETLAATAPPTLVLYSSAISGYCLAMDGFAGRALPFIQRAEEMLDDVGGTPFRGHILVARVITDWLHGRWDEALDGASAGAAELEGAQLDIHLGAFRAVEIDIRANRGELVPDRLLYYRPPTSNMADLRAFAVSGWLEGRGELDAAREELAVTRARSGAGTAYVPLLVGRLVEVEVRSGNAHAAADALAELEDIGCRMPDAWTQTWLSRSRALVRRDSDEAKRAVEVAGSGGLVHEQARSQLLVGELDSHEREHLTAAYRIFQRLGDDRRRRRAAQLLTSRGAKVPRRRADRTGVLTEAEMAIAKLVQQGMRNKEIAAFLHYSPRTIEVYLSRIYSKLAVSSRLELARALDAQTPSW